MAARCDLTGDDKPRGVSMASAVHAFKGVDRTLLKNLGLVPEQVEELQAILPICAAWLRPPLTTNELVRKALLDLAGVTEGASASVRRLMCTPRQIPDRFEAWQRLLLALHEESLDERWLTDVADRLHSLASVLTAAAAPLLDSPRRHHAARIEPIGVIDRALLNGFNNHHGSDRPTPHYLTHVSSSPSSDFFKIASIVYRTATAGGIDNPERAIKSFLRWRRARDANLRREMGIELDSASQKRRGRRPNKAT